MVHLANNLTLVDLEFCGNGTTTMGAGASNVLKRPLLVHVYKKRIKNTIISKSPPCKVLLRLLWERGCFRFLILN